jgi:hypothetical protein
LNLVQPTTTKHEPNTSGRFRSRRPGDAGPALKPIVDRLDASPLRPDSSRWRTRTSFRQPAPSISGSMAAAQYQIKPLQPFRGGRGAQSQASRAPRAWTPKSSHITRLLSSGPAVRMRTHSEISTRRRGQFGWIVPQNSISRTPVDGLHRTDFIELMSCLRQRAVASGTLGRVECSGNPIRRPAI